MEATLAEGSHRSERSVEDASAALGMGCTRLLDRVLAAVGKLCAAPTEFVRAHEVDGGGILFLLPALLANGLLRDREKHFQLPKGFYSATHILLFLAFMFLARVRSVEQLRQRQTGEWGKWLGLDRIPEVRTVRKKIRILAQPEAVQEWAAELSQDWLKAEPDLAGRLYVDGHVRVYHGSRTALPKRFVSREKLCLRGLTDWWVNDQTGRPFFVVSTPFNDGMLAMLREEIVPRLLREVPGQPTQEELDANLDLHRFLLIVDREGWSPEFFAEMWKQRIAVQTYRKNPSADWPVAEFTACEVQGIGGNRTTLWLAERQIMLGDGVRAREVRRRSECGHQTAIVGTDFLSSKEEIAAHMFARWSQENWFKYMNQHFGLDKLADNELVAADETRMLVNPTYRKLESRIKSQAGQLARRQAEFGELQLRHDAQPAEVPLYAERKAELLEKIGELTQALAAGKEERAKTPRKVRLGDLPEEQRFSAISPVRKHFLDTIRMIVYRAETALYVLLREGPGRDRDGRALLQAICRTPADFIPDYTAKTLTVRLHHLANPISDQMALFLADKLNEAEVTYPDTPLRLRYELVSTPVRPSVASADD